MKSLFAAPLLILLTTACAHSQKETPAEVAPAASAPADATLASASQFPAALRVPLPYTFFRRGAQVRVNSVETVSGKLQVNMTLQESKGVPTAILASTLMEARVGGQVQPYVGNNQSTTPEVKLEPNQRLSLDVLFQSATPSSPGAPVEIQFSSGKWWGSQE